MTSVWKATKTQKSYFIKSFCLISNKNERNLERSYLSKLLRIKTCCFLSLPYLFICLFDIKVSLIYSPMAFTTFTHIIKSPSTLHCRHCPSVQQDAVESLLIFSVLYCLPRPPNSNMMCVTAFLIFYQLLQSLWSLAFSPLYTLISWVSHIIYILKTPKLSPASDFSPKLDHTHTQFPVLPKSRVFT